MQPVSTFSTNSTKFHYGLVSFAQTLNNSFVELQNLWSNLRTSQIT